MTERGAVLDEAKAVINGERQDQYGNPESNFEAIGRLWSEWLGTDITGHDVAVMMCLFKIGRLKTGTHKKDSYVDLCGYAALAADMTGDNQA